jgi:hypothetical protein
MVGSVARGAIAFVKGAAIDGAGYSDKRLVGGFVRGEVVFLKKMYPLRVVHQGDLGSEVAQGFQDQEFRKPLIRKVEMDWSGDSQVKFSKLMTSEAIYGSRDGNLGSPE